MAISLFLFLYRTKIGTDMRKEYFEEGQFYHIYNRGVDKRVIFTNDREKLRFINSLYVLNNFLDIPSRFDIFSLEPREFLTPIKPYVKIVAGCLMSNHYHLMLTPLREKGVSQFLHKSGSSYAHYFNRLHERTGRLFESTFKAKHVDRHEYAAYLTQYIHLNPVELYRTKIGTSAEETLKNVENYQWSSLPIYLGKESPFSLIVAAEFRDEVLDMDSVLYKNFLAELYQDLYRS